MTPILAVLILASLANGEQSKHSKNRPLVIGHRGACGMYPEHTALAYRYILILRQKISRDAYIYI